MATFMPNGSCLHLPSKPRIKKQNGIWSCISSYLWRGSKHSRMAYGESPSAAYEKWAAMGRNGK